MSIPIEEAPFEEIAGEVKQSRQGKRELLRSRGWVEFSTYPSGKKISLYSGNITSVSEGPEGEAVIAVKNGQQGHVVIQLLDLYGPALRSVLLASW